jgi:hypothetical protein
MPGPRPKLPLSTVKPRACKAPGCRNKFVRERNDQIVCSVECACRLADHMAEKRKRIAAKAERAEDKERKEGLASLASLAALAQAEVNRYVRLRDHFDGCISCDKPASWGGQWHASHFKPRGSCSSLRFNLFNIHKSCSECNSPKHGNLHEYRPRLVEKIGARRVEWLDNHPRNRRYERGYLIRLRDIFRRRANAVERLLGLR